MSSTSDPGADLRGFGPLGILAIVLILIAGIVAVGPIAGQGVPDTRAQASTSRPPRGTAIGPTATMPAMRMRTIARIPSGPNPRRSAPGSLVELISRTSPVLLLASEVSDSGRDG